MKGQACRREEILFWTLLGLSLLFWGILIPMTSGLVLIYLLLALGAWVFVYSAWIARMRGDAIHLSARQYADLYRLFGECCERLALKQRPECYLLPGKGAAMVLDRPLPGRRFVVLWSGTVDALEAHKDALRFYIGRELAHVACRRLCWRPLLFPACLLPLLGPAYARARERSRDQHGLHCCRNPNDAAFALAVLAAGPRRWSTLAIDEYAAQLDRRPGLWMSFHELISGHSWLARRVQRMRARALDREPEPPRRSPWAWLLALFVPHVAGGGRLGAVMWVLTLLAVFSAIAWPAYQDHRIRAWVEDGLAQAGPAKLRVARYIARNHKAPSSNIDVGQPRRPAGRALSALGIGPGGAITLEFSYPSPRLRGRTIVLRPRVLGQRLSWSCRGGDLASRYRPPRCR